MLQRLRKHTHDNRAISIVILFMGISLFVLITIMVLRYFWPRWFEVESRWLIVAAVPILVGLIVAGYVRRLKILGVELETIIEEPLRRAGFPVIALGVDVPMVEKESSTTLYRMSAGLKSRVRILSFVQGQQNYDANIVAEYLLKLANLEFIQIKQVGGEFFCLLPVSIIRPHGFRRSNMNWSEYNDMDSVLINEFINSLREQTVLRDYSPVAVTYTVNENENVLTVFSTLKTKPFDYCPVTNDEGRLIGIVTIHQIERRITEEVISEYQRTKRKTSSVS